MNDKKGPFVQSTSWVLLKCLSHGKSKHVAKKSLMHKVYSGDGAGDGAGPRRPLGRPARTALLAQVYSTKSKRAHRKRDDGNIRMILVIFEVLLHYFPRIGF